MIFYGSWFSNKVSTFLKLFLGKNMDFFYLFKNALTLFHTASENPCHYSQGGSGSCAPPPSCISGTLIHRITKLGRNTNLGINSLYVQFWTALKLIPMPKNTWNWPEKAWKEDMDQNAIILYNSLVLRHAGVIARHCFYVSVPGTNLVLNCLLPERPYFGLNIKFDQISFHRFIDMPISFLAPIFKFRPPHKFKPSMPTAW